MLAQANRNANWIASYALLQKTCQHYRGWKTKRIRLSVLPLCRRRLWQFSLGFNCTVRPRNTNLTGGSFLFLGIIDRLNHCWYESQFYDSNEFDSNQPFRDERRTSYGRTKVARRLFLRSPFFSKTLRVTCEDGSTALVKESLAGWSA